MFVDQLIPDRSLVLVTGKPKHGKSFVAIDILDTICLGQAVFGAFKPSRGGTVLYVCMEDGEYETANRLLARGMRPDDERPFYVINGRLLLTDPRALAHLRTTIEELKPNIVVLDTAREACGIRDWTDPAEVSDKIRAVRELAREFCPILLVSHNRKADGTFGDEIAGTNAFTSSVDGWISIQKKEPQENGNLRLWTSIEGRGTMRGEPVLEMDTHTLHVRLVAQDEIATESVAKREERTRGDREKLIDTFVSFGVPCTVPELSHKMGLSYAVVSTLVKDLIDSKLVMMAGTRPNAGRGRPSTLYALTPSSSGRSDALRDPSESRLSSLGADEL
jgi:KaiC/GvpD/RAD55 family RecA-like ATPase